ncbi:MAG TPA: TetR/AcrR family transcriptional regulator [Alphaproteobacteria bacterium]|nr:TetR/AcrR family transcriptional regulator [Alphaproteobacteria bacterium]
MKAGVSAALPKNQAPDLALPRRQPIQGRSQDRVQRILRAAAELVDRMPLDEITMAVIAKEAGASFSSIYRFFPSKEAILEDVVLGYLDQLEQEYEQFFARMRPEAGAAHLIDGAIDIYIAFVRREPGFKALWLGWQPTPAIVARFHQNNKKIVELAMAFATTRLGMASSPELDLRLAMAGEASSQLLRYAFTQRAFDEERVVDELKRFLKATLLMLA